MVTESLIGIRLPFQFIVHHLMGFRTLFLLASGGLFFGFTALVSLISLLLPSDILFWSFSKLALGLCLMFLFYLSFYVFASYNLIRNGNGRSGFQTLKKCQ